MRRPRKGDLYVVLNDGRAEIRMLLESHRVTALHRNAVRELQGMAVRMLLNDANDSTPPSVAPSEGTANAE